MPQVTAKDCEPILIDKLRRLDEFVCQHRSNIGDPVNAETFWEMVTEAVFHSVNVAGVPHVDLRKKIREAIGG